MIDIDLLIDNIIFGRKNHTKTINTNKLPIDEQFLINIVAPRTIKRIPSLAFCFEIERRYLELVVNNELYISDVEVFDNLIRYFKKFPRSSTYMIYVARMLLSNRPKPLKFWPKYSIEWRYFSKRISQHIINAGSSFHRICLVRKYHHYILLKDRLANPGPHLIRRSINQGVRRIIAQPPQPTNNLQGNPLFTPKTK